jgi:hypothetical protein
MIGVNASWYVTMVIDLKPWWNFAAIQRPSDTMRQISPPFDFEKAVAKTGHSSTNPYPTTSERNWHPMKFKSFKVR